MWPPTNKSLMFGYSRPDVNRCSGSFPKGYLSLDGWASMNSRRVTTLLIVVLVLLAGCSSIGPGSSSDETTTESAPPTTTATSTPTPTPTQTTIVKTPPEPITTTTPEKWTPPKTPKDPENKPGNRILNGKFVNKQSSGNGFSSFDIQVKANTSFGRVDPTPDVGAEPYLYVEINGKPIAREEVGLHKNNVYRITIRDGALKQFDSGSLDVTVTLYDTDHDFDDNYGTWEGTINYNG